MKEKSNNVEFIIINNEYLFFFLNFFNWKYYVTIYVVFLLNYFAYINKWRNQFY